MKNKRTVYVSRYAKVLNPVYFMFQGGWYTVDGMKEKIFSGFTWSPPETFSFSLGPLSTGKPTPSDSVPLTPGKVGFSTQVPD